MRTYFACLDVAVRCVTYCSPVCHQLLTCGQLLQVDSVIQETKNLMNGVAKVVTTCFICTTKVSDQ